MNYETYTAMHERINKLINSEELRSKPRYTLGARAFKALAWDQKLEQSDHSTGSSKAFPCHQCPSLWYRQVCTAQRELLR